MKHAYLILAHNEFEVLTKLISALDDFRNDIFIHFDQKVKKIPDLNTKYSNLFVIKNRVDLRWGDSSIIDAEIRLMSEAVKKRIYKQYHILSGTHLPLYSQDYLHGFFNQYDNNFIMKMGFSEKEIDEKVQRYNFFIRNYANSNIEIQRFVQLSRNVFLKIQRILGIKRYRNIKYYKASQWVSLTHSAIELIISQKKKILKQYKYTYCGDEFFVPTLLENSKLKNTIIYSDQLLKCDFTRVSPIIYLSKDFDMLISSGCLFARKFSIKDLDVVDKILQHTKKSSV